LALWSAVVVPGAEELLSADKARQTGARASFMAVVPVLGMTTYSVRVG
jgi:hypothetical protein